ncbi:MAG: tRNA (adenosine(37)-N6)-threonylcarbamoyltransferase complex ATPase subunit type 1 TsaE [Pseudomonadota bacterium]
MSGIRLNSEIDTARLARVLVRVLATGQSLGLKGDLGAGKTTLVRYLVAALGGDIEQVASPSFTLQNDYSIGSGRRVEHWDLYRLREAPEDISEPPGADTIRIVEWPERSPQLLQELDLLLEITVSEAGERYVCCFGPKSEEFQRAAMVDAKGEVSK